MPLTDGPDNHVSVTRSVRISAVYQSLGEIINTSPSCTVSVADNRESCLTYNLLVVEDGLVLVALSIRSSEPCLAVPRVFPGRVNPSVLSWCFVETQDDLYLAK